MNDVPYPKPWNDLRESLAGSFTARARGLLAGGFVLLRAGGEEFGRLELRGLAGADLSAGEVEADIRQDEDGRYRMASGGAEILTARRQRGSADRLEVSCGGRTYEARTSFLRNDTTASSADGRTVRVRGNLSGRGYEAAFDAGDGCAPAVAVFLLYHTAAYRRRAYLTSR